jgi:hypothetical protein
MLSSVVLKLIDETGTQIPIFNETSFYIILWFIFPHKYYTENPILNAYITQYKSSVINVNKKKDFWMYCWKRNTKGTDICYSESFAAVVNVMQDKQ